MENCELPGRPITDERYLEEALFSCPLKLNALR